MIKVEERAPLEGVIEELRKEISSLRQELDTDRSFGKLAIAERDYERARVNGLTVRLDALTNAAQSVLDRWDTPNLKTADATAQVMGQLRRVMDIIR